ncbi:apelin isoform X1 [Pongo pygmaeus]|uniref:apelin isoform X1 n=1 Tax=Pongo pygmaeus TaxID=9600 RepID=UPI00300D0C9E
MNLRLCVQALLLLWLSLTAVCGGECAPSRSPGLQPKRSFPSALFALSPPPGEPGASRAVAATRRPAPGSRLTGRPEPWGGWPQGPLLLRGSTLPLASPARHLVPPNRRSQSQELRTTGSLMPLPDGNGLEEGNVRHLVQPRGSRNGPGPWQGGRRKFRRQRPRLSHKGPMPF